MSLKIETVNLCDGFSDEKRIPDIFNDFKEIQPDIAVFPEAYKEGEERYIDDVKDDFDRLGYVAIQRPYMDSDDRLDRHGLVVAARRELILGHESVRLATSRYASQLRTYDPETEEEIDLYGVHLKDRPASVRYDEAVSLLEYIDPDRPAAIVGDLNNMKRSPRAAILRTMGYVARKFPQHEPGTPKPAKMMSIDGLGYIPARLASLVGRLGEMAEGDVIELMEANGLYDDAQAPTMSNKLPLAKLDFVMLHRLRSYGHATMKNRYTDHRTFIKTVGSLES